MSKAIDRLIDIYKHGPTLLFQMKICVFSASMDILEVNINISLICN